ncbi:hypothetical protein HanXRQr2_Chr12g0529771 [Helianthus annuus]|uniref:Uncharacterized protein n=1 Tax=Helianthus annuus TaxID=4232 RepID=A0A9K3ENN4_HELAN|nr:hypothetical protein HanXRQr2_Chr12g0529771 [Helianthus annuus]KAJ0861772.1 hypothetical protein HanPSC8_Chr12g0510431 [Helianthus annuus]
MSKMSFSTLTFGRFCDFRPKVCFSTSGSKRFEILPFSSDPLTPSIFFMLSPGYYRPFTYLFIYSFIYIHTYIIIDVTCKPPYCKKNYKKTKIPLLNREKWMG